MVNLSEYKHCTLDLQLQFERMRTANAVIVDAEPVWLVTSVDGDGLSFERVLAVFSEAGYRSFHFETSQRGHWIAMVFCMPPAR